MSLVKLLEQEFERTIKYKYGTRVAENILNKSRSVAHKRVNKAKCNMDVVMSRFEQH